MGRLIVTEFMTLDGVAQAPGRPDEDPEGGFDHGGWQMPLTDRADGADVFATAKTMDALLLGRKTYDIFAGYWPTAPDSIPFTGLLNGVPKYVASRTVAEPLSWQGSSLVGDPFADAVIEIKKRHQEVHVIGSLNLLQSLLRHGLVDRMELWVYPLLLGTGKKVFVDGVVPIALRLAESVTYPSGLLQLTYDVSGPPTHGDVT